MPSRCRGRAAKARCRQAAPRPRRGRSTPVLRIPFVLQIEGSITALATPFASGGSLDLDGWRRHLARQRDGGTQAVVVAGSTGEAAALTDDEYAALLRAAVEMLGPHMPVLAGTGQSSTARTIERTRAARDAGAHAALVVTPPYVRPTQAGLDAHFRAVADDGGLPVILYNVPTRTGVDLTPETAAALRAHAGIVGIKEARAEPERMQALLALQGDGFAVLSGDDPTSCRAMLAGARGCISVASNVVPRAFRALCDAARARREDDARAIDRALQPLYEFLGVEPNPIPVKAALAQLDVCADTMRLPLLPLSATHRPACATIAGLARTVESRADVPINTAGEMA